MDKGIYIKDIAPNMRIEGLFVASSAELAQSAKGDPFWRLRLQDCSGVIEAKIWSPLSNKIVSLPSGSFVYMTGKSSLYRDQLQITVESCEILDDSFTRDLDLRAFMPASPLDLDEMFDRLTEMCLKEFVYSGWREFVFAALEDPGIQPKFRTYAAAKKMHHAYLGGLMEHTLGVMRLCLAFADQYPFLDRQTLLAGALFHDIGKICEFSGGVVNDYTDNGNLLGHIFLGIELIEPFLSKSGLPPPLWDHLRHLILSHHGEPEYGAAKLPQTPEAIALHYADNLDAKMAQCRENIKNCDKENRWSPKLFGLERKIFYPLRTSDFSNSL